MICLTQYFLFCFVLGRVSLCNSSCPKTLSIEQAGIELKNPPASISQVLELNMCTTTALWLNISYGVRLDLELVFFLKIIFSHIKNSGLHSILFIGLYVGLYPTAHLTVDSVVSLKYNKAYPLVW